MKYELLNEREIGINVFMNEYKIMIDNGDEILGTVIYKFYGSQNKIKVDRHKNGRITLHLRGYYSEEEVINMFLNEYNIVCNSI